MKTYNLKPQEKNNYCICSVFQAIFDKYNIKLSQEEIANSLTPSEFGFRVDDDKIESFMKELNFDYNYYWLNEVPFNEPDTLLNEINEKEVIIGCNHHSVLAIDFNDPYIKYLNPGDKRTKVREIDLGRTLRQMRKSGDGFFGLIKHIQ